MKADDLRPILKSYAEALEAAGARRCADALQSLLKLFDARRISNPAELSHRNLGSLASPEYCADSLARLSSTLVGLRNLLACAGNQAASRQLQLLLDAIREQSQRAQESSVEAVASASNEIGRVSVQ